MKWFLGYHRRLMQQLYCGNLFDSVEKLEHMAPFLVGAGLTTGIALGFDLIGKPVMLWVGGALCAPGIAWFIYVAFHEIRSLPERYRRHRGLENPDNRD